MDSRSLLIDTLPFLGPRLALDGLTPELAELRAAGAPHTIAEIAAHMAFWTDWFRGRCDGTSGPMPPAAALGWPTSAPGSWTAVYERLIEALEALVSVAASQDPARRIDPPIEFPPLADYTVGDMVVHVALHNAHHAGQIVLLRQLLGSWPPPAGRYTW